jgi:transposase-like protein
MECPGCGSVSYRKNGKVNGGKQRYLCRDCGRNFTQHPPRGYPMHLRITALKMANEGLGYRAVGRLLGVSNVTVLKWVRQAGQDLKQWYDQQVWQRYDKEIPVVELDEIWHFCQKNSNKSGFGLLFVAAPDDSSPLKWAIVPLRP